MATVDLSLQVANAIPVVVGGLLAVMGGVASQYMTHRLSDSREKKKRRRDRIESLVKAAYAHEQWVVTRRDRLVFRNESHDEPAPLDEVRMLQALHFPELAAEVMAVQKAFLPMLDFINKQRIARMKDEQAFMAAWDATPFNDAYAQHLQATKALVEKCRTVLKA
jgi:hypothetical protein